jgi:hypothetical protein
VRKRAKVSVSLRRLILGNHQAQNIADRKNAEEFVSFGHKERLDPELVQALDGF